VEGKNVKQRLRYVLKIWIKRLQVCRENIELPWRVASFTKKYIDRFCKNLN